SPGATSRLGIDTDPLPPGVTSCDRTASVIARTRRWLELRSASEACTSTKNAPPRAVALVSPQSTVTSVTGESAGRSTLRWTVCACAAAIARTTANPEPRPKEAANGAPLLRIHTRNRHLPGIRIHIPRASRPLYAHRNRHGHHRTLSDTQGAAVI